MADARARFLDADAADALSYDDGAEGAAEGTRPRRKWRRAASVGEENKEENGGTAMAESVSGKEEEEEAETEADGARPLLEIGADARTRAPVYRPSVDETAFGLPRVELPDPRAPRKSSLQMIAAAARGLRELHRAGSRSVVDADVDADPAAARRELVWTVGFACLFVDAMYVLVSVPLRLGFFFDPWAHAHAQDEWSNALTWFSTLDALGEFARVVFVWQLAVTRRKRAKQRTSTPKQTGSGSRHQAPTPSRPARKSFFSMRQRASIAADSIKPSEVLPMATPRWAAKATRHTNLSIVALAISVIPVEIVIVFLSYNWIHAARVYKLILIGFSLAPSYSKFLLKCRRFRWAQWLSFSTLALPFYLFWLGLYLCHLSACGFMLIANIECGLNSQYCVKTPIPGSWVLKDKLERATLWRKYLRALYWASETVTTLGQGDLVPATLIETQYCVAVQFISGLWATAFLASCSFYFSRRDRDIENGVSTRLEQALRFLRSRKVPSTLALQIRHYYQHIQRTRNGIEEDQVLLNLPGHYRSQCSFFVKYRLLAKIFFFSEQPKAFLKSIVDNMEGDFLSPKQTIVAMFDPVELIIVAKGDISVFDQSKVCVRVVSEEEWIGDEALFEDSRSRFELEAKSFCEVLRLSRQQFQACMEKHFPRLKIAAMVAQQSRRVAMIPSTDARLQQVASPVSSAQGRTSGRSTILFILQQAFGIVDDKKGVTWCHPGSNFRRKWRLWKVAFMLFVALEVPFEVAFQWRTGFFGETVTALHQVLSIIVMFVEIFFYLDWYFRACVFFRACGKVRLVEVVEQEARAPLKMDELATKPGHLLQLYLLRRMIWIDIVANIPIAIVWNFADQSPYGIFTRQIMRWPRVFALLRLSSLKQTLKKIMVERDFSPAFQLLVNVIVFCVVTSNAVACYFYLLADDRDFYDALPLGFNPDETPVSFKECLEMATLTSNCTWFIYDRSTYSMKARYLRSLHWSLVVLSSVVYGDIVPFTNSECLLVLCWIYLGTFICYFTSCAVGSVVSQMTVLRSAQKSRLEAVTRALVRTDVSSATRILIRSHYEANWEMNGSTSTERSMLEHLPQSLRHQLSSSLYVPGIRRCYVFSCLGGQATMLQEIALLMSAEMFLPKVTIVENGHLASAVYIVLTGDVELLLPFDSSQRSTRQRSFLLTHTNSSRPISGICGGLWKWLSRHHASSSRHSRGPIKHEPLGIPVAALKEGDCFGEEGLLPDYRSALRVSARTLTGTQIAILTRDSFMSLAGRFPVQVRQIVTFITRKQEADAELFDKIRGNFRSRPKAHEFMGMAPSLYCDVKPQVNNVITTNTHQYRLWRVVHAIIIIYNFYVITFRLAFLSKPSMRTRFALTIVDYITDTFLYADIYLKWNRFGYEEYGDQIVDLVAIRQRYMKGWLHVDCWSMLPLYYYGDSFFIMSVVRLPRLLRSVQIFENLDAVEALIREKFMRGSTTMLSVFDLFKFLIYFLSAAHHVGSIYFLLGRFLTEYGYATSSWMRVDVVINAYPGDILVQYNRAIYWCLETFTVVCFGDVLARNVGETIYAFCTCIVGWMCIGQVVGRITSLMANIDKDTTDHNARVDNFEQYARENDLPQFLRERAIESAEYKSKSLIELNLRSTFEDLPPALHAKLFEEMYGAYVRRVPELAQVMKSSQLRVLTDALVFRIYVTDDIIFEEGRLGSSVYIMKEGRAEYFSAKSMIVFAAIYEGHLFGDTAFFIPDARHLSSVRASRSCQVLELERCKWNKIWDENSRRGLEANFGELARQNLASTKVAHSNIARNFDATYDVVTGDETKRLEYSSTARDEVLSSSEDSGDHEGAVPDASPNSLLHYRSNLQGYSTLLVMIRGLLRLRVARKVSPQLKYGSDHRQSSKSSAFSSESRRAQKLRRSLGMNDVGTIKVLAKSKSQGAATGQQGGSSYLQHLDIMKSRFQKRQARTMFNLHQLTTKPVATITGGTANDIWVDPPLPPSFCLEHSKFRQVWSTMMFFICLYFVLIIPFRVSFDYEFLSHESSQGLVRAWFLGEYTMDVLCVIDFVLNKNYFTFVNHGTLVTEKQAIRDHYLREGTYLMDLFGILPFEIMLPLAPLGNAPGTNVKVTWYRVAVFRLNKMVRIAHLRGLGEKLQRMLIYDMKISFVRPSVIYFFRLALDFVLGAHWLACLFYGATYNGWEEGSRSWLTTAGMLTFDGHADKVSTVMKYTRSFYFSMGTITTVTYGDITPQNAWETLVSTIVIIISIVLFGMLSGGFSRMFEMELGKRADYEEKIASVAHFMMYHQFPTHVWKHMQSYFIIYWSESQGMNEDELLVGLPLSVKKDITFYVKQDIVKQIRLFAGCDEAFVRAVVAAFDRELFVRNDVIISYGDRCRSLYVIESGSVLVRVPQSPAVARDGPANARQSVSAVPDLEITKSRFDYFGEQSLIFDIPRSATCVALSSCSMLILTVAHYEAIIEDFPEYREKHMNDWVVTKPNDMTKKQSLQSLRRPQTPSHVPARRPGAPVLQPRASA